MKTITVLLAEDHTIVRQGLRELLKMEEDIEVVGEAANGHQAVALASQLMPDVIIMDLAMPMLGGLDAIERIRENTPASTKVLVLSAYDEETYIRRARELGASGYLVKQGAAEVLATAIREIHRGGSFFKTTAPTPAENPRTRGAPAHCRGQDQQGNRRGAKDQHQDSGETPPASPATRSQRVSSRAACR